MTKARQSAIVLFMTGKLLAGLLVLATFALVGCGSDDDKRPGCCRIQHVCGGCACPEQWQSIGNAGDEDACDKLLENPDVGDGCSVYDGDEAIRACS